SNRCTGFISNCASSERLNAYSILCEREREREPEPERRFWQARQSEQNSIATTGSSRGTSRTFRVTRVRESGSGFLPPHYLYFYHHQQLQLTLYGTEREREREGARARARSNNQEGVNSRTG